ncbi:MAG: ammonium transporter [Planctomycetota bacterium]|nr:ammonium transporter [Planctomycetota bacterium]
MKRLLFSLVGFLLLSNLSSLHAQAAPEKEKPALTIAELAEELKKVKEEADTAIAEAKLGGHNAWMLTSSALVMLMVPGLALFYGGMVQRKNVLATMMESMASLSVVGVFWIVCGYGLAFGPSVIQWGDAGGLIGWHPKFFFLQGVETTEILPATSTPVYTHVLFQGMFAIITPALISGAIAERIRFVPFTIFSILWVTIVYCPLAHMVWAFDWFYDKPLDEGLGLGGSAIGLLGKWGALDFAGGTVVHIAAGFAGLACSLALRKRIGFPSHVVRPNSMVLTLLGAGLLWFGWFGFNGGSAVASNFLATSAFAATQAAAAAAGLSWMLVEYLHKGKPTALGLASGIVAGLVAVTPAAGFVYIWGGLIIGLIAGAVCYGAVQVKSILGYDDTLDAFGVHGIGGFLGAILTGVFCFYSVNSMGTDGFVTPEVTVKKQIAELEKKAEPDRSAGDKANIAKLKDWTPTGQVMIQIKASIFSALFAFILSYALAMGVQVMTGFNFSTDLNSESEGLDETEHGETGFDFGTTFSSAKATAPRSALSPPNKGKGYIIALDGPKEEDVRKVWSDMCQAGKTPPSDDFKKVYPYLTTINGNKFKFRGGDPNHIKDSLSSLFQKKLNTPVKATVEA